MLRLTLKFLHLLGLSALFGGILSQTFEKERRILKITRLGGVVTVLSGIGYYFYIGLNRGWDHINTLPFAIKMVLVAISVGLSYIGGEKMSKKVFALHVILLLAITGVAVYYL